ncbi:protein kinase [Streptomyces sp. NPDC090045]|uniref:protein kinase domain-containing protein n=1 Tax=Streptomyces sp. NPDC090045 TaxID=3365927 RepID=UPI0037FD01D4
MDPLIADDPAHIGPYRLIARLGAGGMGRVYLARSEGGRTVAVKVVQAELAHHPEFRRRFAREVAAARRVGGRWTAPVLDADTEAITPWVATGYVPGPDLHTVVAERYGPLPEPSVLALAHRLALALGAIHQAGLIHRDLKPSNVLIAVDGPRVIDFGIARPLETLADGVRTRTGAVIGSPGFMSPEQVRGQELTPACDLFCLGSVLAYAATGRAPFGSADLGVHALMLRVAEEEPDLEGLTQPLFDLIRDCLHRDPVRRPTPQEVAERAAAYRPPRPWLPGELLEQLGRDAAKLLDFDPARQPTSTTLDTLPTLPVPELKTVTALRPQPEPGPSRVPRAPKSPAPEPPEGSTIPTEPGTPPGRGRTKAIVLTAIAVTLTLSSLPLLALVPRGGDDKPGPKLDSVPAAFLGTWEGEAKEKGGKPYQTHVRVAIKDEAGSAPVAEVSLLNSRSLCVFQSVPASTEYDSENRVRKLHLREVRLKSSIVSDIGKPCGTGPESVLTIGDGGGKALSWAGAAYTAELERYDPTARDPEVSAFRGTWEWKLDTVSINIPDGAGAGELTYRRTVDRETCQYTAKIWSTRGNQLLIPPGRLDQAESTDLGYCKTVTVGYRYTIPRRDVLHGDILGLPRVGGEGLYLERKKP